jgi:hypothetical protein
MSASPHFGRLIPVFLLGTWWTTCMGYTNFPPPPKFPFSVPLVHVHDHALGNVHDHALGNVHVVERLHPFSAIPTFSAHSNITDGEVFACRFHSERLRMVRATLFSAQEGQLQSHNFAVFPRVEVIDLPAFVSSFIVHPTGAHLHMELPLVTNAMRQRLMPLTSVKHFIQLKFPRDAYEPSSKSEFFMSACATNVQQLLEPWMAYMEVCRCLICVSGLMCSLTL